MPFNHLQFNQRGLAETFIAGTCGNIETLVTRPETMTESTPVVVICHPHPLYGGSMTNKVVHILAKTFSELGAVTVRFNFRGVGESEGEFAHGIGEAEDLQLLVTNLRQWLPHSPLWLAGFSFGAYVVARTQAVIKADKLLLVAPPVSMYDFDSLPEIAIPWLVIQGGQDEVIEAGEVKNWVETRLHQPKLCWFETSSHFFHGKLLDVKACLLQFWPGLK